MNFDRLDYLNNLSRFICKNKPDAPELQAKLQEVMNRPEQPRWQHYIAGVMGGAGFAVFFNTNFMDTIVAVLASLIIVALGEVLGKYEHNPLIFNAIIACIVETFIILAVTCGLGEHVNYITIGVVMLLISGIGFTNGIRDLLHRGYPVRYCEYLEFRAGCDRYCFGNRIADSASERSDVRCWYLLRVLQRS